MISTGTELESFITSLNGGATIDASLLDVLVDNAKAILEEERDWTVLRKTDTSKSITTSFTWQTAIDLSTITDFNRFYSDRAVKLFDGENRIHYYILVPFDRRIEYKDVSATACYDENSKILYLNGKPPFTGSLYINYISTSEAIDLTSESAIWTVFPSRFLPILGYYSIGIHKGAIDYDSINKLMLPTNKETLNALKNAMEIWDNLKQEDSLHFNDPSESIPGGFRDGAINRDVNDW